MDTPGEGAKVNNIQPQRLCGASEPSSCSYWLCPGQHWDHHTMDLKPIFPNLWETDIHDTPPEPWGSGGVAEQARLPELAAALKGTRWVSLSRLFKGLQASLSSSEYNGNNDGTNLLGL